MKNASTDLLGVDIGGTNVKIGVIDSEYNVKEFIKFKTEKDDVDAMLGSICGVIRDLAFSALAKKSSIYLRCSSVGDSGSLKPSVMLYRGVTIHSGLERISKK